MARYSKLLTVNLSPHSIDRWHEYVGRDSVARISGKVRRHVFEALKDGIEPDSTGAGHVEIYEDKLWAVVMPGANGGWDILTFHRGEHEGFREYWSGNREQKKNCGARAEIAATEYGDTKTNL